MTHEPWIVFFFWKLFRIRENCRDIREKQKLKGHFQVWFSYMSFMNTDIFLMYHYSLKHSNWYFLLFLPFSIQEQINIYLIYYLHLTFENEFQTAFHFLFRKWHWSLLSWLFFVFFIRIHTPTKALNKMMTKKIAICLTIHSKAKQLYGLYRA